MEPGVQVIGNVQHEEVSGFNKLPVGKKLSVSVGHMNPTLSIRCARFLSTVNDIGWNRNVNMFIPTR